MESAEYKISDRDKHDFTDAFDNCWSLLKINNYYINKNKSETISWRSSEISHEMYKCMLEIIKKMSITQVSESKFTETLKQEPLNVNLDVTIDKDTKDQHEDNNHLKLSSDNTGESINNIPPLIQDPLDPLVTDVYNQKNINKKRKRNINNYTMKDYVIKLALDNPNWTLEDLKKYSGFYNIKSRQTLQSWLKSLQKYGQLNDDNTKQLIEKNELLKKRYYDFVPYDLKKKLIELTRQNPSWSITTLRNQTGFLNISFKKIKTWENDFNKDGLLIDKKIRINNLVFAKCLEFKKNNGTLTNALLRKWHDEAIYAYDIKLSHSLASWMHYFKKEYGIDGNSNDLQLFSTQQDNDDGRSHEPTDGPLDMDNDNKNINENFVDKMTDTSIKISDALSSLQMVIQSTSD